jgi:hypothetical protein
MTVRHSFPESTKALAGTRAPCLSPVNVTAAYLL